MSRPKNLPIFLLAILLGVCLFAYFSTRDSGRPVIPLRKQALADQPLVDSSLVRTAVNLTPLAASSDEQGLARDAWRLADHSLDLTFASAIREAEADSAAAMSSNPKLRQLSATVARLKDRVAADKQRVEHLGPDGGDELDVAQAQLDLDQDELDNAQQDLAQEGGEKRSRLQRLLREHESSDKVADQALKFGGPDPTGTMAEQLVSWLSVGRYQSQLAAAANQAASQAHSIEGERSKLDTELRSQPTTGLAADRLRALSLKRKKMSELDERMSDAKQLVTIYQSWGGLMAARERSVLHQLLLSVAAVLAILLAALVLSAMVRRALRTTDRHRLHQLRLITRVSIQVAAVLLILLIAFGPPTQLPTMIGLVTAGLTVVMKDFIVAFFGWFTLMGKNGIRVGDWVEIEGVSGEVVEIGLLKTVLLELGNWTETGHPTGRRVTFSNSFAMERHYFNFSTADQWLWDELRMPLPAQGDPHELAEKIREVVERESREDADAAAEAWQRVTREYGTRAFSAGPTVNIRPAPYGLEAVVRYITRAPRRNLMKARMFQQAVELIRPVAPGRTGAAS
jgi:small-conductance mechanosensitive channel